MQQRLELAARLDDGCQIAHGIRVDYNHGVLTPCTTKSVASLLRRIHRYGVHAGSRIENQCNVLTHSVLVGEIARRLASTTIASGDAAIMGYTQETIEALVAMYGSLHDAGEIFGGDIPNMVPIKVRRSLKTYQSKCRDDVCWALGIPKPDLFISAIVKLADIAAVRSELEGMGIMEAYRSAKWRGETLEALEAMEYQGSLSVEDIEDLSLSVFAEFEGGAMPSVRDMIPRWLRMASPPLVLFSSSGPGSKGCFTIRAAIHESGFPHALGTKEGAPRLMEWFAEALALDGNVVVHDLLRMRRNLVAKTWVSRDGQILGELPDSVKFDMGSWLDAPVLEASA